MEKIATLEVLTESDAWLLLESTLAGKILIETEAFHLKIGSWPLIHLKIEGDKFQSSISTKMMQAFIDLQNNIYRTYAKMQYDTANGRLLTNEDKAALELMVEVHNGSSKYKVKFDELAKWLIKGAISKMEGKHYLILGLAGLLTWSSQSMFKSYIAAQAEQKKIETQVLLSKEETHRLELMKEASKQVPYVAINNALNEEVINKMLKSAQNADSIAIGDNVLRREQINELIRAERSTSKEVRLDGEYRILKVDSSKINFFKVELQNKEGKRFWAVLQDATVTKEMNKVLLQEAEWNKKPINLVINGTEVRGEISSASIIDVKDRYLARK